jgi:WD40 repeat protein
MRTLLLESRHHVLNEVDCPSGSFVGTSWLARYLLFCFGFFLAAQSSRAGEGLPLFTYKGFIQAGGIDIQVTSYSAPLYADWNNDGLPDLIAGEKSGVDGKIRVYLNRGTPAAPVFSDFTYARTDSGTLLFAAAGCLGVYPRVYDWDGDGKLDLIAGLADGTIKVFLNVNTAADPVFGPGVFVQAGAAGLKGSIVVSARATLTFADWNDDGKTDLVVGDLDGKIRVYLNDATSGTPNYRTAAVLQLGASNLLIPSGRSTPLVWDIDGDGKKDLLSGNTDGKICLYLNTGTDAEPKFDANQWLAADGQPINIGSQRSRICLADMNGDGLPDLLSGGADGKIRYYQQKPAPSPMIQYKSCGLADGHFYMEIVGGKGLMLSIDYAENLTNPMQWHPLLVTNCPSASLVLTQEVAADPQRFFRVRQSP